MAKTRSQTGNITIKKEEEEEDSKDNLLLNGVTTATRNKITKRQPSKRNNRHLPAQQVKVEEEDTDIKSLLESTPKPLKISKRKPRVLQEQINQLIDYVVNHGMSVTEASHKVRITHTTGFSYYYRYKNDPEKKIPSPRNGLKILTQEQIENLIKYIENDKMTINGASAKANMGYHSGYYYYNKYLKDPNHNIPISRLCQYCTQDQKNEFIGYIVNDKMSIRDASRKARMGYTTASTYYHKYFDNRNHDMATPSHINTFKCYTQEQIKEVISYIIDDKMSIAAASRKANMSVPAVSRHYRQYLKDLNMELPMQTKNKSYTQGEINKVVGYIVDDKMSINAASKKAKMCYSTGYKHYHRYLNHHNLEAPTPRYTQDQKSEFIGYIVDDKMTVKAASKKANIHYQTAHKYYRKYLKN